jgi:hypothetical protein
MLVTRQCDTGRNTWSSSKLEAIYQNAATPRMSNFEPLQTQPDWREQYSPFPLPGENGLLQPSFEQQTGLNVSDNQSRQQDSTRPVSEHRHSLGPLRQEVQPAPLIERPDSAPGDCGTQVTNSIRDDSLASTESTALSLGSNPLSSASSAPAQQGTLANNEGGDMLIEPKEEEEEEDDDDEMLDAEVEEGAPPQTAAERRAERRKMKRFRYDKNSHTDTLFMCIGSDGQSA